MCVGGVGISEMAYDDFKAMERTKSGCYKV